MELSLNGKKVSTPRTIVREGQVGSVTEGNSAEQIFIEVVAKEGEIQNHKGIMMNFVVGKIGHDGQKTIMSRPQILTKENEAAQVALTETNGQEAILLSVVAQRKSL